MADAELAAMSTLVETLEPLEDDARERVVLYVQKRFKIGAVPLEAPTPQAPTNGAEGKVEVQQKDQTSTSTWSDFGELYYDYRPTSNSEKVLVAGYWLQEVQQQDHFTSFQVNKLLKDMGEGITKNIYRDFERLVEERPHRVIFLSGSGAGRNKYKLTVPGIKSVVDRARSGAAE